MFVNLRVFLNTKEEENLYPECLDGQFTPITRGIYSASCLSQYFYLLNILVRIQYLVHQLLMPCNFFRKWSFSIHNSWDQNRSESCKQPLTIPSHLHCQHVQLKEHHCQHQHCHYGSHQSNLSLHFQLWSKKIIESHQFKLVE